MSFLSTSFPYDHISTFMIPKTTDPRTALDAALSILHDHTAMCRLNPVVRSVSPIDSSSTSAISITDLSTAFDLPIVIDRATDSWSQYSIVDELPLLFGKTWNLTYSAAMRNTSNGLETLVAAPSNVSIHALWDVSIQRRRDIGHEDSEGDLVLVLKEASRTNCGVFVAWYIKNDLVRSHRGLHAEFQMRWERMLAGHE